MNSRTAIPTLDEIRDGLRSALESGRARKAIVFGSYARGEADEYSDLDLIVIADTDKSFFYRHKDFSGIYDFWHRGLDLLIYTPEEFASMIEQGNPFIERALEEGVVIYEE